MNGQYLMNRQLSISYAFKKDTRGERHGTPAERLLAAQARAGSRAARAARLLAGGARRALPSVSRRCPPTDQPTIPSTALLPPQKRAKEKKSSRPHTLFSSGPQQAPGPGLEPGLPGAALAPTGFAAGMAMPPPPMAPPMGVPGAWRRCRGGAPQWGLLARRLCSARAGGVRCAAAWLTHPHLLPAWPPQA